ncbi:cytochrome P450 [Iodidimonas sp. SYSU 1G8]|uniref:cytochrome P450 n=1 Tax=Iodidimonas sp. SYSU 1G8 TaxID=3133967 RepID=UPI0031FE9F35
MDDATRRVEDFSLMDHATQSDPFAFYAAAHSQCPVYRMPETGFYVVTRYDDLRQVLKDTETFSNDVSAKDGKGLQGELGVLYEEIIAERGWAHVQTLQRTDPPLHSRYRKLLDRVFTAKRVREMQPYVDQVANDLIDSWIDDGECEFNMRFAMPMPGIIIAEQLGLDRSQVATFKRWADALIALSIRKWTEAEIRQIAETELEMQHYLFHEFEKRREKPTGDLISALVHAHGDDEEALSMHELQNLMHQLISGGFETTQSAIAHGMWLLLRHPETMQRMRDDMSLIKPFCEEAMRIESPVQGLARKTTREVELNGTTIPAGSMVLTRYGAANRDPEKFACPHLFDIDRKNAGAQIAFGAGVHFCVGASLARQEMVSSFTALLTRLDDIELARELPQPVHNPSLYFMPMKELPIRFRKR